MYNIIKVIILVGVMFCGLRRGVAVASVDNSGASSTVKLSWLPKFPRHGDVLHLFLAGAEDVIVKKAEIAAKSLPFFKTADSSGQWHALYGIDPKQKPGDYVLNITLVPVAGGSETRITATISILQREFPEEHLNLDPSKVQLSADDLVRVRKENSQISSLWSRERPERLWNGPFIIPAEGRPGSTFGLRRIINGEPRNFHTGMDIKVPEGTPIKAANDGIVSMVGDHFFAGRSVFIDHGQGLYTMYFHLSDIKVVEGQKIAKGEIIGLAGMTGRASGPHLHWGVRLGGARINPQALIEMTRDWQ